MQGKGLPRTTLIWTKLQGQISLSSKICSVLGKQQSDQIGQFLKGLGDNFSYKSRPNIWHFLSTLKKVIFQAKAAVTIFWKLLLLVVISSGHTGKQIKSMLTPVWMIFTGCRSISSSTAFKTKSCFFILLSLP